ncbi:large subunit ribosomal protein L24e [Pseudohyphozyma bogoriensis]|nr:large subunit ribosomal protein L24e [Pseudohyphozyma bogoriensis]
MSPTVYLVSGANRGVGLGLVTALAARPNTFVYAGARDVAKAGALESLSEKYPGVIKIVELDYARPETAKAVGELIEKEHSKVDVVIANAGNTPLEEYTAHFQINTLGPVALFQGVHAQLKKSDFPKFILISTAGASIAAMVPFPIGAYKVAANFSLAMIHQETPGLTALAIHPGIVQTDMGNPGAVALGLEKAPDTVEDSAAGVLAQIDAAKKGDKAFVSFKGETMPWMKRNPRKLKWTKAFRKAAGKEMTVDSTLTFEKRRNVPVVYDRDLLQATLKGMRRIAEIKAKREKAFFKARMAAAAPKSLTSDSLEVSRSSHLLSLHDPAPKTKKALSASAILLAARAEKKAARMAKGNKKMVFEGGEGLGSDAEEEEDSDDELTTADALAAAEMSMDVEDEENLVKIKAKSAKKKSALKSSLKKSSGGSMGMQVDA